MGCTVWLSVVLIKLMQDLLSLCCVLTYTAHYKTVNDQVVLLKFGRKVIFI